MPTIHQPSCQGGPGAKHAGMPLGSTGSSSSHPTRAAPVWIKPWPTPALGLAILLGLQQYRALQDPLELQLSNSAPAIQAKAALAQCASGTQACTSPSSSQPIKATKHAVYTGPLLQDSERW